MKYLLPILFIGFIFTNCKNDIEIPMTDPVVQLKTDIADIKSYLTANNLTAEESNTGLHYIIEEKGTGNFIDGNSSVNLIFTSYFLDGEVFDAIDSCTPITLNVDDLIEGMKEGLSHFNVGGKGKLFIPSVLAFGQEGNNRISIPGNTVIAFDIEIVELKTFENKKIKDYLLENNITADSTDSGIFYTIEERGSGDHPTSSSRVTVLYKGYYLDGTVFDSSDTPATFDLNSVILGWKEAIPLLKPGGKGTFFIPSERAYGTTGSGSVPPNRLLVFDVELIEFN